MRALRQVLAALVLPGVVAGVIPAILAAQPGALKVGWGWPFPWSLASAMLGGLLFGLGLALLVETVRLFANSGQGTLAPWDPPRRLVVQGIYRYVRNPMISGVFCLVLGEAVALGSAPVLAWWVFVVLLNLVYIPLSEEPGLARRFGADYARYCQNVPRWIPRRRPWQDADEKDSPAP